MEKTYNKAKKYNKKKSNKFIVEIKTNSGGWKRAILLRFRKGGAVIKLKTGEIINFGRKNIKYGKTRKVARKNIEYSSGILRYLKTKKMKQKKLKHKNK